MTEFEIKYLIIEQQDFILVCTQIWLTITSAFIVVSYLVGGKLNRQLRSLMLVLYILFSLPVFGSWVNGVYGVFQLYDNLSALGIVHTPSIWLVGETTLIVQILGYLFGIGGAVRYFLSTKANEDT